VASILVEIPAVVLARLDGQETGQGNGQPARTEGKSLIPDRLDGRSE
jgi:hypothetical protein